MVEDVDKELEEEEDKKMAEESKLNGEAEKEGEDKKMTGAEEMAKREAEAVEEGGSNDMDKGGSDKQSTSRQRIHFPKKDTGERGKKAAGQTKLNFKKVSRTSVKLT